jgi:hypothetical protein
MKKWKGWLALVCALYLFFLIWMIPAGLCWAWWAARPGSGAERITMVDLHGPWSAGNCALIKIGPLQFEHLTWKINPLALLRGRLEFALAAALPDSGKATAILGLGRHDLELRDLQLRGPAAPLGLALLPGVNLSGTIAGKDLRMLFAKGIPVEVTGELAWQGAGMEMTTPVLVGELVMQMQTGPAGITANLKDRGGPLRIAIQAGLKPGGIYEVNGDVAPRGAIQPELATLLSLLGPAAADGRIRLTRTGRLNPLY